jgi:hypothetical protein
MVSLGKRVKAEMRKRGSEKTDYRYRSRTGRE